MKRLSEIVQTARYSVYDRILNPPDRRMTRRWYWRSVWLTGVVTFVVVAAMFALITVQADGVSLTALRVWLIIVAIAMLVMPVFTWIGGKIFERLLDSSGGFREEHSE